MKKKQIIIGVILLISIASMIIIIVNNNKKRVEDKRESTVENGTIEKDIEIENITFSKAQLKYENGITTLTANVKSKKDIASITIKIIFLDETGNEIKNTVQVVENITVKEQVFATGFVGNYETVKQVKFEIVKEK